MTHPNCDHMCTSNCRREGCNCLCGEFHDSATAEEVIEMLADELRETRIGTVEMLLNKHTVAFYRTTRLLAGNIVDALFIESPSEDRALTIKERAQISLNAMNEIDKIHEQGNELGEQDEIQEDTTSMEEKLERLHHTRDINNELGKH